jgi:hypothetical protein
MKLRLFLMSSASLMATAKKPINKPVATVAGPMDVKNTKKVIDYTYYMDNIVITRTNLEKYMASFLDLHQSLTQAMMEEEAIKSFLASMPNNLTDEQRASAESMIRTQFQTLLSNSNGDIKTAAEAQKNLIISTINNSKSALQCVYIIYISYILLQKNTKFNSILDYHLDICMKLQKEIIALSLASEMNNDSAIKTANEAKINGLTNQLNTELQKLLSLLWTLASEVLTQQVQEKGSKYYMKINGEILPLEEMIKAMNSALNNTGETVTTETQEMRQLMESFLSNLVVIRCGKKSK